MERLSIDIETFSDVDLTRCGVYRYVDSDSFEILLFAYTDDDGDIQIIDLAQGEKIPQDILQAIKSPNIIKTAYNAQFERVCLSKYLGIRLDPASWYCTAVQAAELSLPASLADVGAVLGLDRQKMTEGRKLIRYFCIPCRPCAANGERTRNLPEHDPEKWKIFKEYCKRDVEVERAIAKRLHKYPITKSEHDLYVLDQRINDRGVAVDMQLAKAAVDISMKHMKDKSGPEKLQGYWILELGELAGMRKTDVETVKSFISRVDDKYRASYGVNVENHPRQCVIVGSTNNETGFLRDITGNRRFWPIRVTADSEKKSWQLTDDDVRQIWAETMVIYHSGEKLYLEGADEAAAVKEQTAAMETDEREGLVRSYLSTLLPDNWDEMSVYDRRNYLSDSGFGGDKTEGRIERRTVCNMEIWCECFGRDGAAIKKSDSYEIAAIMRKIGWDKGSMKIVPLYGKQRLYIKTEN